MLKITNTLVRCKKICNLSSYEKSGLYKQQISTTLKKKQNKTKQKYQTNKFQRSHKVFGCDMVHFFYLLIKDVRTKHYI